MKEQVGSGQGHGSWVGGRDSRHEQGAPSVGDAAPGGGWGVFVVAQRSTQQAQVVEGQDQDQHAAQRDAASPPVSISDIF